MRLIDVEDWTSSVVESVLAGQPIEDARVELAADWIDPRDAARRVAAYANTSRGDDILWVFGIDLDARAITGVEANHWVEWWQSVESEFEGGAAPTPTELVAGFQGVTLVAVGFDTSQAPFVVKTHNEMVPFEVPWRDGGQVRGARRAELILLLSEVVLLPQIQPLRGEATVGLYAMTPERFTTQINLALDVHARGDSIMVFPFHQVSVACRFESESTSRDIPPVELRPESGDPPATWTNDDLTLSGPTVIRLVASGSLDLPLEIPSGRLFVHARMVPSGGQLPATVDAVFEQTARVATTSEGAWTRKGEWTRWGHWRLESHVETSSMSEPLGADSLNEGRRSGDEHSAQPQRSLPSEARH